MNSTPVNSVSVYVFPERALRRWMQENLRIAARPDGGADAVFRFEGSTCGNISFLLDYRVTLEASAAGWRLASFDCAPAPLDDGHGRMCCWQESAEAAEFLMRAGPPLRGEPLDAILAWRPKRSPAGCLCAEPSRDHKWQAVLETLHYALRDKPPQPAPGAMAPISSL